ncbi:oligosaccharide flippase family protein [Muricoccus roseus]|nr:oligosaccharide flippase family protein [Roseomonas rosea]
MSTTRSVGTLVAAGAMVMVLGRVAMRSVSVVSTLLLVRLLQPADFGLVALAAAAFVIADQLTTTNYAVALVRRPEVDRDLYDTAWTMNVIRCLILGGLVAATADLQAGMLGDSRLAPVLMVVALTVSLDGLVSIGMVRLQREFQFGKVFRYQIAGKILSFLLTIALAFIMQSYWCLVLGNLGAKLLLIPYSYFLAPHRPRFSLAHWRELLHFSKWMMALNLCLAADGQGPNLVLGRLIGVEAVGRYNISYQIAATPVTELAAPIRAPIYSGYARVLHDLQALRRQFLEGFALICTLTVPLSVGIALTAPEVQHLALGPRWTGTETLIVLCALYALVDSLSHFTFNIFSVLDRQRRFAGIYALLVLVRLPCIILAALWAGAEGVLAGMLATGLINGLVWHWQAGLLLGHGLADVGRRVWRAFVAAGAMAAMVLLARDLLPAPTADTLQAGLRLVALAMLGAGTHVAAQLALWRLSGAPAGAERRILDLSASGLARLRGAWSRRGVGRKAPTPPGTAQPGAGVPTI